MTTCVDLAAVYGRRFRLAWEADGATRNSWPAEERLWLREIRCRYGRIYPIGGTRLGAFCTSSILQRRLARLPGVVGHGGEEARFDVEQAEAVFAIMRPHRRRTVSAAERERLVAAGARHRFQRDGLRHGVNGESTAAESTNDPADGPRPVPALDRG